MKTFHIRKIVDIHFTQKTHKNITYSNTYLKHNNTTHSKSTAQRPTLLHDPTPFIFNAPRLSSDVHLPLAESTVRSPTSPPHKCPCTQIQYTYICLYPITLSSHTHSTSPCPSSILLSSISHPPLPYAPFRILHPPTPNPNSPKFTAHQNHLTHLHVPFPPPSALVPTLNSNLLHKS